MKTYVLHVTTNKEEYTKELLERVIPDRYFLPSLRSGRSLLQRGADDQGDHGDRDDHGDQYDDMDGTLGEIWIPKKPIHEPVPAGQRGPSGRKIRLASRILFPSYLFFNALSARALYTAISELRGYESYFRLLGKEGDLLREVRPEELEWIRKLTGDFSRAILDAGRVKIISGSMKGMDFKIVKLDKRKENVLLEMTFFGREMKIWVGLDFVEPLY